MNDSARLTERVEALRQSMQKASLTVQGWSPAKREGAEATVYTKPLAAYYESTLPKKFK